MGTSHFSGLALFEGQSALQVSAITMVTSPSPAGERSPLLPTDSLAQAFLRLLSAKVQHKTEQMLHAAESAAYRVLSSRNGSQQLWSQEGAVTLNGFEIQERACYDYSVADGIPIHLSRPNLSTPSLGTIHCLLLPVHPLHYSMRPPIMGVCLMKHLNCLKSMANLGSVFGETG